MSSQSSHTLSRTATRTAKYEAARATLAQGLHRVATQPKALVDYLAFRARFREFSPRNTLLIAQQRPTATCCMGFRQWKQHGRQVKKGEKGLMILVPRFAPKAQRSSANEEEAPVPVGFRVGYVFDMSQTQVIEGQDTTALQYVSPVPVLQQDHMEPLVRQFNGLAQTLGFLVVEHEWLTAEGYCSPSRKRIGVRASLPAASKAATLAHEIAHALAHPTGCMLSKAAKELQAEGAAYLACAALGLDTSVASLPYLRHYETDTEALVDHLAAIDRIAWQIVDAIDVPLATPAHL